MTDTKPDAVTQFLQSYTPSAAATWEVPFPTNAARFCGQIVCSAATDMRVLGETSTLASIPAGQVIFVRDLDLSAIQVRQATETPIQFIGALS